ncbi:ester cyclase [Sulfurimonas sp. HSL-1716]|uniref:ester cyclase n=1 Tax=Hydrocurvibacter sulfurireducens TaxID=3131937 RepID=UPI0031F78F53
MDNKQLVSEYYAMWNSHDFTKADLLLDGDVRFRGSLDIVANGIDGFKDYAKMLFEAFPNLYHAVEILISEGNVASAYVTYSGKHEGKLLDYEPTKKRISYSGASFFHFKNGKIASINVLGDLNSLYKQIGPS